MLTVLLPVDDSVVVSDTEFVPVLEPLVETLGLSVDDDMAD